MNGPPTSSMECVLQREEDRLHSRLSARKDNGAVCFIKNLEEFQHCSLVTKVLTLIAPASHRLPC